MSHPGKVYELGNVYVTGQFFMSGVMIQMAYWLAGQIPQWPDMARWLAGFKAEARNRQQEHAPVRRCGHNAELGISSSGAPFLLGPGLQSPCWSQTTLLGQMFMSVS